MINGNELVRYFSEIEDERYYSDYEIEDLYEKAFSEGYEFAQREFAFLPNLTKSIKNGVKTFPSHLNRAKKYTKAVGDLYGTTIKQAGNVLAGGDKAAAAQKIAASMTRNKDVVKATYRLSNQKLGKGIKLGSKIQSLGGKFGNKIQNIGKNSSGEIGSQIQRLGNTVRNKSNALGNLVRKSSSEAKKINSENLAKFNKYFS